MQDIFKESEVFGSSDLAQVATLAMYFPIEAMDRGKSGKVSFFFKRSAELDVLLEEYWRGDIQVEPKAFFNQVKIIKSRLYGQE
jgi:hypothetical protein